MAHVPKEQQAAAEAAGESWGQFKLLDPGLYSATLDEVDATRTGPSGMYWAWVFKYDNQPGKAFLNTSFSPKAIGSVGAVYRAFDAPIDTDTDELIGERVVLAIVVSKVKKGERKGQLRNEVASVLPYEEGFEDVVQGTIGNPEDYSDGDEAPAKVSGNGAAKSAAAVGGGRRRGAATPKAEDWE